MKHVICDSCGKDVPATVFGVAPDGWFTLYRRGDRTPDGEADFCSTGCVIDSVAKTVLVKENADVPARA